MKSLLSEDEWLQVEELAAEYDRLKKNDETKNVSSKRKNNS